MKKSFTTLFLLLACVLPASGAVVSGTPAGVPFQVFQPSYGEMQFYVTRPTNMPAGWFMTYDGYAVQRGKDGVWYYGSRNGVGVEPTRHAVGAVVPSVAGLVPWVRVPEAPATGAPAPSAPAYVPPYGPVQTAAYTPAWARNPAFLAIRRWKSVDRLGILTRPAAPVAWKGKQPKVIYVWTGNTWYQVTLRLNEKSPLKALRGHLYELAVNVGRSGISWTDADSTYLAHYAAQWGFGWMGPLSLNPAFYR